MPKIKILSIIQQGHVRLNAILNNIAMYRLVLYVLMFFVAFAFVFSFFGMFGLVPFTPVNMLFSLALILGVSWITNVVFAYIYKAPSNIESVYITALILFCIITPPQSGDYVAYLSLAGWASVWAMASKYIVAYRKKHIFNPAAFALVLTSLTLHQSASWWIGRGDMLAFVPIGGLLIAMKIRRFDMVISFAITALATIGGLALLQGSDVVFKLSTTFTDTAFLFFAFIMLTEPITAPPTKRLRIVYGILVGVLFAPNLHVGTLYSTPELALVLGNIFSYAMSPKEKFILKLKERIKIAHNTYEYVFSGDRKITFRPGQYMEWTLAHPNPDTRGNRRYFTLASSPTEHEVRLGVRQFPESSSYKKYLQEMEIGTEVIAAQCAGDFVLPRDPSFKLVFIAGGIGITPFRSMMQYLLDTNEKRTITVLYSNRTAEDIAYKEIFNRAVAELGVKISYFVTDPVEGLLEERMVQGKITEEVLKKEVSDYMDRRFYISGPNAMVSEFKSILKSIGVKNKNIKTDYFPGL